jgi:hypothetical protein
MAAMLRCRAACLIFRLLRSRLVATFVFHDALEPLLAGLIWRNLFRKHLMLFLTATPYISSGDLSESFRSRGYLTSATAASVARSCNSRSHLCRGLAEKLPMYDMP